jgi:hypothetical protein
VVIVVAVNNNLFKYQIMTEKIKTLKVIHLAICAGVILAYIFAGQFTIEQLKGQEIDTDDLVYLIVPIAAFFLSNFMFKSQLNQVEPKSTLEEKLPVYQTASIIRWAILEGGAFLILFMKPDLLIFGIILILYLISLRPTEEKIISDFQANIQ